MTQPLLVIGSIAFDTVQTPHGVAEDVLGGSAVYFSVAASYFAPVRLVGVVGEDFRDDFRAVLEARDIDTAGLQIVEGGETFRWRGTYEGDMNEARTDEVHLNVFGDFRPEIPAPWRETPLVFLANGSPATQMSVLEQVERPALVVADTMNLWIETTRDALVELLGRIDGLVLNDAEARMLTGESNLVAAAEGVLDMGPRFVVVKKGEHGAILVAREHGEEHQAVGQLVCPLPGFPCPEVRDPTGAGDSFAGGMMGYLAGSGEYDFEGLRRAMAFGTVTASFTVEDFSLRRLEGLSREDIEKRLTSYRDMLTL